MEATPLLDTRHVSAVDVRADPGDVLPQPRADRARALYVFAGELRVDQERVGLDSWAFVPCGSECSVAVEGEERARVLELQVPHSAGGAVVVRRAGGDEGETIGGRSADRRATLLVDVEELTVSEFAYGPGQRGASLHVHRHHADAFFVVQGALALHHRAGTLTVPALALAVVPPGVVHGFDNDASVQGRYFNLHLPASGFGEYLRGRNPDFDQHDPPSDGGVDPDALVVVSLTE